MPETFHVRLPVLSDPQGIAARGFGLRSAEDLSASSRPKHPARRTRGTTSRTQGSQSLTTNLVILLRQDAYTTRVLGCKNSERFNALNLFVISDKSAISFKDLSV